MTMDADDLRRMLRHTYAPPDDPHEWALWFEATLDDGRRVDAVACNLWESRGRVIRGHEIKVTRADWLAELRDPGKADGGFRACDEWYVVAPPGVVLPAELPAGWGLMEPARTRVSITVKPPARRGEPGRDFWTRLLTKTYGELRTAEQDALRRHRGEIQAQVRRELEADKADKITVADVDAKRFIAYGRLWLEHIGPVTPGDKWGDGPEVTRMLSLLRRLAKREADARRDLGRVLEAAPRLVLLARRAVRLAREVRALNPALVDRGRRKAKREAAGARHQWGLAEDLSPDA